MPEEIRTAIRDDLQSRFAMIFEKLGIFHTRHVVEECTVPADYQPTLDRYVSLHPGDLAFLREALAKFRTTQGPRGGSAAAGNGEKP